MPIRYRSISAAFSIYRPTDGTITLISSVYDLEAVTTLGVRVTDAGSRAFPDIQLTQVIRAEVFVNLNFIIARCLRHTFNTQTLHSILCLKNEGTCCLIITVANVNRFSKFFHQQIREKIRYVNTQRFPPSLQYVATLACEIRTSEFSYESIGDNILEISPHLKSYLTQSNRLFQTTRSVVIRENDKRQTDTQTNL